MKKEPLTIEWQIVEDQDTEARLLAVLELLLKNENLYDEQPERATI